MATVNEKYEAYKHMIKITEVAVGQSTEHMLAIHDSESVTIFMQDVYDKLVELYDSVND